MVVDVAVEVYVHAGFVVVDVLAIAPAIVVADAAALFRSRPLPP